MEQMTQECRGLRLQLDRHTSKGEEERGDKEGAPASEPWTQCAAPAEEEVLELSSEEQEALLSAAIQHLCRSIRTGPLPSDAANRCLIRAFTERHYYCAKDEDKMTRYAVSCLDASPDGVSRFILDIFKRGFFDVVQLVVCIHYLKRFTERSGVPLHVSLWRPLFLTALLISDKMWEDRSVKNSSITLLFPVLGPAELYDLEVLFLKELEHKTYLSVQDYKRLCDSLRLESSTSVGLDGVSVSATGSSKTDLPCPDSVLDAGFPGSYVMSVGATQPNSLKKPPPASSAQIYSQAAVSYPVASFPSRAGFSAHAKMPSHQDGRRISGL